MCLGAIVSIISPIILLSTQEAGSSLIGSLLSSIGCIILSILGSNLLNNSNLVVNAFLYLSLFFISSGCVWIPSMSALIAGMYPCDIQGEVQGVITQISVMAFIPGFLGNIIFSVFISDETLFFW